VEPGDAVASGDPLVRLETKELQISLQIAEREVAAQQAMLDRLLVGEREQVIARADRENAQQVAQAEVALEVAVQRLEQARARDPSKDVAVAQAMVRRIELQIAQARAQDPASDLAAAQVALERAKIALDDTQNEYSKALDRPWEDQRVRDEWKDRLEQVQLDYRLAQAQLDGANKAERAHAIGLQALAAQLQEAQTRLGQAVEERDTYTGTLNILSAEVGAARLQLEHLRAWDNPHRDEASDQEIAEAEARLQQTEWNVAEIERQIEDAEVRAPFDGTVGQVNVRVGELVPAGQALVTVGDLETLRVETTDLDEIDVARVAVDQPVTLTFDAFSNRVFHGRVTRISPMAESGTGGVHYTVVVELEPQDGALDPALRWGMTAFVDIEVR
jgi:multidrug resistance efflux pump